VITTVTLWLLIGLGSGVNNNAVPVHSPAVIERFATQEECTRVQSLIRDPEEFRKNPKTRCIQATVVVMK